MVNGYLLALAALFALGGRLGDIFGHAKCCVIGVIVFAGASTMCGLTPKGSIAEAWIVAFRVIQGAGAAHHVPCRPGHRGQPFRCANGGGPWPCSSASPAA